LSLASAENTKSLYLILDAIGTRTSWG
jgi:hypothetical protein